MRSKAVRLLQETRGRPVRRRRGKNRNPLDAQQGISKPTTGTAGQLDSWAAQLPDAHLLMLVETLKIEGDLRFASTVFSWQALPGTPCAATKSSHRKRSVPGKHFLCQRACHHHQCRRKKPYQGIVPLQGDSLTAILQTYFDQSEQLPTRLWLAASLESACGLLLQQMPGESLDDDTAGTVCCMLTDTVDEERVTGTGNHGVVTPAVSPGKAASVSGRIHALCLQLLTAAHPGTCCIRWAKRKSNRSSRNREKLKSPVSSATPAIDSMQLTSAWFSAKLNRSLRHPACTNVKN